MQTVVKNDAGKSKSTKSSKSNNKAISITNLWNSQMKIKKAFKTLNNIIEDMEHEDSEWTNSDEYDKEKLHFHFDESYLLQEVQQITGVL